MCYNLFLSSNLQRFGHWQPLSSWFLYPFNMSSLSMKHLPLTGIRKCSSLTCIFPVPAWINKRKRSKEEQKEYQQAIFLKVKYICSFPIYYFKISYKRFFFILVILQIFNSNFQYKIGTEPVSRVLGFFFHFTVASLFALFHCVSKHRSKEFQG